MSGVIVRLPGSLHRRIRELAKQDEISINQFIATVVAEKVAALLTVEYLEERGRRSGETQKSLRRWLQARRPVKVKRPPPLYEVAES